MNQPRSPETSELIDASQQIYDEFELDSLPSDLKRDSKYYYYLSVYPGLRHMTDIGEEDTPTLPDTVNNVYIHTPYCTGVCNFCSYYLTALGPDKDDSPISRYFETVKTEALQRSDETNLGISYMYFGGGTPSLIPLHTLESFFDFLNNNQFLQSEHYGTIELHPEFFEDMDRAQTFIDILKANGIGRVSIGFQSSDEDILDKTNRRHDTSFLKESIAFLKANGMIINLDLMYGLPDLTLQDWEKTLREAIQSYPDSITPYFLFTNPGTIMRRKVDQGHIKLPSHRMTQVQHIMTQTLLAQAGFHELPSDFFSRPSTDPREFTQDKLPSSSVSLPLGAGSYGFYDKTQFFNQFSIAAYRKKVEAGKSPIWRGYRFEGIEGLHRDVMFSFKNSPYLDIDLCKDTYGVDPLEYFEDQIEKLTSLDLVTIDSTRNRIYLTAKGRLCVEEVCWQFIVPNLEDEAGRSTPPSLKRKLKRHHFAPLYELVRKAANEPG